MATYKCKYCSHEVISTSCPIECEICGSFRVLLLENFKVTEKVDEPERDNWDILNTINLSSSSTPAKATRVKKVDEPSKTVKYISHTKELSSLSVPSEVKGWNWGAFLLNFFWSIGNNVWIGLLCAIPYLGFVMLFLLGLKGNEWAWKSRKWASIEKFKRHQRRWTIASLIIYSVIFLVSLVYKYE